MIITRTPIVGFDCGNSETTLIAAGRSASPRTITVPSYRGTGTLEELKRIRGGIGTDALEAQEYVLTYKGESSFIGGLAIEQSTDATSARGDVSRYWNGHTLRLLLALAGASKLDRIRVVTGLPVQVWSKENARQVQRAFVGEHTYMLNGSERTLTIEGVLVVMEGAGALGAYGMTEDVPQAVIDIGGRTTDLFWAHGSRPVMPRCTGDAIGVEKAADNIAQAFTHTYHRDLQPRELRGILRAYANKTVQAPALFVNGQRVDLNGIVEESVSAVGREISSFVSRVWRSSEQGAVAADAARVLLIGGGPYYFSTELRQIIPHLDVPRLPELANAQGYFAIGSQIPEDRWGGLGLR